MARGTERLKNTIQFLDNEQSEVVADLITLVTNGMSKGDLMKFAYDNDTTNVDSALPLGIKESFEDAGLEFNTQFNVMSYKENRRRVQNLGELLVLRLIKELR
tara:strand:+ start:467 stop:775 length:309 start_codon:yes stop_codon:yes gene_type:complete